MNRMNCVNSRKEWGGGGGGSVAPPPPPLKASCNFFSSRLLGLSEIGSPLHVRIAINVNTTQNSLVPQLMPIKPATQVQLYESTPSVHVPPF